MHETDYHAFNKFKLKLEDIGNLLKTMQGHCHCSMETMALNN